MKKSVMFFSLILTLVLMCGLIFTNNSFTNKNVYAGSVENGHIIVVGKGEVETKPDMVRVSFSLKCRAESLQEGQTKMRETIKTVTSKINEYNKNAEVYTNYSSSYPVFEGGLLGYEFDSCLIAKSPDVDNVNGLVDAIVEAGATSVHSVSYILDNKDEAYILALKQAKQNAQDKVLAIYDNVTLKGLKEEAVYNYCEGQQNEKIKISAKVTAFYEVNSPSEVANNKNAFNEKSTSTTSAQAKLETKDIKKAPKNDIVNKENKLNKEEVSENKESLTKSETNKEKLSETSKEKETLTSAETMQNSETTSENLKPTVDTVKEETTSKQTKKESSEEETKNKTIVKESNKSNAEPLSIIDANGNVVLEII